MLISTNNAQSFGSIQVNLTKMTSHQRSISDRLFNSLKYSEKYSKLTSDIRAGEDLDIYMIPKGKKGIEVRFMDPYSGMFVREKFVNTCKIIREELFSSFSHSIESATDKIIDTYEKIVNGVIARPKEDVSKFVKGDTEMHRINPNKAEDLSEMIAKFRKSDCTPAEAEEQAFEGYKGLYHIDNQDADF